MQKLRWFILLFWVVFKATLGYAETLSDANNKMAFRLYETLVNETQQKFLFSPVLLIQGLLALEKGATDNTALEIRDFLGVKKSDPTLLAFLKVLEENQKPFLKQKSHLFINQEYYLRTAFVSDIQRRFNVPIQTLDFSFNPKMAKKALREWFIKTGVGKNQPQAILNTVNQQTGVVLLGALRLNPVISLALRTCTVEGVELVEIPYGQNLSLFLLKSDKTNLSLSDFQMLVPQLQQTNKGINLPLQEWNTSLDLTKTLQQLGITSALTKQAKFKGITSVPHIQLSSVIQGISLAFPKKCVNEPCLSFFPPFTLIVRENNSHTILAMGRMTNPE